MIKKIQNGPSSYNQYKIRREKQKGTEKPRKRSEGVCINFKNKSVSN